MVWEVIGAVESTGLKVIVVTTDGASPNRKFFRMHEDPSGTNVCNGVMYKTTNIYAPEREIYCTSDVPHLMKTARNCWEKSCFDGTRLMQVHNRSYLKVHDHMMIALKFMQKAGHYILWKRLEDLHKKTQMESGLYMGKKLTREYICLTSYLRMRVDLTALVHNQGFI